MSALIWFVHHFEYLFHCNFHCKLPRCREHCANLYAATGHTGITPVPSSANFETKGSNSSQSEVEETPLIPLAPQPSAIELDRRISHLRNPLVRQRSAPSSMNPPRSAGCPTSVEAVNREIIANLPEFADVQLRSKSRRKSRPSSGDSGDSVVLDPEATAQAFRKALRSTSVGQYKRVNTLHTRSFQLEQTIIIHSLQ